MEEADGRSLFNLANRDESDSSLPVVFLNWVYAVPNSPAFIAIGMLSIICLLGYTYGISIGNRQEVATGRFWFRRK